MDEAHDAATHEPLPAIWADSATATDARSRNAHAPKRHACGPPAYFQTFDRTWTPAPVDGRHEQHRARRQPRWRVRSRWDGVDDSLGPARRANFNRATAPNLTSSSEMHAQPNSNYMDRTGQSDTQARDYEP